MKGRHVHAHIQPFGMHLMNGRDGFPVAIVGKVGSKGQQESEGRNQGSHGVGVIKDLLFVGLQIGRFKQNKVNTTRETGGKEGLEDGRS